MNTFDLRSIHLRPGEQHDEVVELDLEPLTLGGQEYEPAPSTVTARLRVTRATSGIVLELAFETELHGPCFRCLEETSLTLPFELREYQASASDASEDERSDYVTDDRVDLSDWARDAIALALPDKILCRPDCAGLCPVCGKNLNVEPHEHEGEQTDARWAALEALRDRL